MSQPDPEIAIRRETIRTVLNKVDAMGILRRTGAPLQICRYQLPGYRVATIEEVIDPANRFLPSDGWKVIQFWLHFTQVGDRRVVGVICHDMLIGEPFRWTGYDNLPDNL